MLAPPVPSMTSCAACLISLHVSRKCPCCSCTPCTFPGCLPVVPFVFCERSWTHDHSSSERVLPDAWYPSQDLTPLASACPDAVHHAPDRCPPQMPDPGAGPATGRSPWASSCLPSHRSSGSGTGDVASCCTRSSGQFRPGRDRSEP